MDKKTGLTEFQHAMLDFHNHKGFDGNRSGNAAMDCLNFYADKLNSLATGIKWKKGDGKSHDIGLCLVREYDVNGDYQYYLSSGCIYDVAEYIPIVELEKLPRE